MIDRRQAVRCAGIALAIAACINIAAGVTLALRDPRRASDLWTMVEWCRGWLFGGESLYAGADASTDYPPNAIVLLSPLALVPHRFVVPLWIAGALALTPLLPWLIVRCASGGQRRPPGDALPILLYLCWAAPRTLLQFSLLSMTLAGVALLVVDARRVVGGVALGLALFKPHLAGPVALWMLLSGRVLPLTVAAATALLGVAAYDVRIGEAPTTTMIGWWHVLQSTYTGPAAMVGHTSIRVWVDGIHGPVPVDVAWIAISAALLVALCALAWRDRTRTLASGGLAIPAMFSLWSLLAVYHNGNNMILMLPAFAFLWFVDGSRSLRWRWIPLTLLQGALAFDVPVRLNRAAADGWMSTTIEHFDRIVVLATLALVAAIWWRLTAIPSIERAAPAVRRRD